MKVYHYYKGLIKEFSFGFTEQDIKTLLDSNETYAVKNGNVFIIPIKTYI